MSEEVSKYLRESGLIITPTALRLACQEQMSRWTEMSVQEHELHKETFYNRNLIDCLYKKFGNSL